jgi:hypothetical protein
MKPDRLENLLAAYAAQPLPTSSAPSTAEVWREIEKRRRQSLWSRMFPLFDWRELFAEPRLAVAGVAFAVTVGVVPAMAFNRIENERRLARQSIHFDVFSSEAGALGSVFAKPVAMVANGKR